LGLKTTQHFNYSATILVFFREPWNLLFFGLKDVR